MMKSNYTVVLLLAILFSFPTSGQEKLNTIERAMKDEMDRSMSELKSEEYEAPFFIKYQIIDQQTVSVSASMGALQHSYELPSRVKNIRVMVGDYEFNDESLDDNQAEETLEPYGYMDFNVPLGDDYYGIRRSLWITTDAIYKVAARIYSNNLENLEKEGKTYEDVEHRRFAEAPAITHVAPIQALPFETSKLGDFARKVSGRFLDYENLTNSSVTISSGVATSYFLNSEGTRYRTSETYTKIVLSATVFAEDGSMNFDIQSIDLFTGDDLPKMKEVEPIIKKLMARIESKQQAKRFEDSYYGPVLFTGKTVPQLLDSYLVNQLYTSTDVKSEGDVFSYGSTYTLDDRIDKRIISKNLSVTLHTSLRDWNGINLTGSYKIDEEGVMAPDTLVLIEDGRLKNLMSTRTLVKENQTATGNGSGPGVVSVVANETLDENKLKEQLIAIAKKNELEYAIIVREGTVLGTNYAMDIYKIDVNTGKEELVKDANIASFSLNNLNRISGISSDRTVNEIAGSSYITPGALLIEDIAINGSYRQLKLKAPLVPSPLSSENE